MSLKLRSCLLILTSLGLLFFIRTNFMKNEQRQFVEYLMEQDDTYLQNQTCFMADFKKAKESELPIVATKDKTPYLFLFKAYYDDRHSLGKSKVIRVTSLMHRTKLETKLFCYLWFPFMKHEPLVIPGETLTIWQSFGDYQAVITTCAVPEVNFMSGVPSFVSLSDVICRQPQHYITVQPSQFVGMRDSVAICTKVIYGKPDPIRLIEWIELNKIMGPSLIYMYETNLQGNAKKVLDYYVKKGTVKLFDHSFLQRFSQKLLKSSFPTKNYYQNWNMELLSMTDCLYSARERYLLNIDVDEIVGLNATRFKNYTEVVHNFAIPHIGAKVAAWLFLSTTFTKEFGEDKNIDAPKFLHTIRHTYRTKKDWESPKAILNRDFCYAAGHHICMRTIDNAPRRIYMPAEVGYVRHYRDFCRLTGEENKCEKLLKKPIRDLDMQKHKNLLYNEIMKVSRNLNLKLSD